MTEYFDASEAVDEGFLQQWYQDSIDETMPPIWTDKHLEELCNDFIIIPKEVKPNANVRLESHGCWIPIFCCEGDKRRGMAKDYECSKCGRVVSDATYSHELDYEFCPHCGAEMDGKERGIK